MAKSSMAVSDDDEPLVFLCRLLGDWQHVEVCACEVRADFMYAEGVLICLCLGSPSNIAGLREVANLAD